MNATLKAELDNDPAGKGYAALLPDSPQVVVDLLNARSETMVKTRMITGRAILAECGVHGPAILDKLEAAAASNSAVKWAVTFLKQDAGIDIGHPATRAMIDQMTGAVFTAAEAAALKALASQPASRAEVIGLGVVTYKDVCDTIWNDDGSLK